MRGTALVAAGFLVPLLGGCVASGWAGRLELFDQAAQVEVDKIVETVEGRFCSLPLDVIARRARAKGPVWTQAYGMLCPDLRVLFYDSSFARPLPPPPQDEEEPR